MNCVRPTLESLFGDVPDVDSRKAAEIAKDREKRKSFSPSSQPTLGVSQSKCGSGKFCTTKLEK